MRGGRRATGRGQNRGRGGRGGHRGRGQGMFDAVGFAPSNVN